MADLAVNRKLDSDPNVDLNEKKPIEAKKNSGRNFKIGGAVLITLGGFTVLAVLLAAPLSARFGGPNVFSMGKQLNIMVPGVMAQTMSGAFITVGVGVAGAIGVGVGAILVRVGINRAKGEKPKEEKNAQQAFADYVKQAPGTNKKWISTTLGISSAIIGAAVLATIVVPIFVNMPNPNYMGAIHSAVSNSGTHYIAITTGAIVTNVIGVATIVAGVASLGFLIIGIKEARKKKRLEEEVNEARKRDLDVLANQFKKEIESKGGKVELVDNKVTISLEDVKVEERKATLKEIQDLAKTIDVVMTIDPLNNITIENAALKREAENKNENASNWFKAKNYDEAVAEIEKLQSAIDVAGYEYRTEEDGTYKLVRTAANHPSPVASAESFATSKFASA